MKKWILVLWFVAVQVIAAPMITKVIDLHYQNADQVIKLIQPLLTDGEKVSGSEQTLIVKVTPQTLTQLRAVLHKIDQPPVTFKISVHQGDSNWLASQHDDAMVISTQMPTNQPQNQSVTVMNGESAFVSTGEDQPVLSSVGIGWFTGVNYDRRLLQNGLLVEPVLQGQKVKLTVKRIREQDSYTSNQNFNEQKVMTTVLVPLDQWVVLASADGSQPTADSNTMVYTAGSTYQQNSTLYIKVNVVGKTSSGIGK
ncbi:secretin N-terminal domain-containing protein [Legionella spiritensis]|uniref:secretin N-terminal domain-containing protein n=1 Tax=Legionella spiritensis TaxID=452 RepID=UPI000F6C4A51|nr:secretin N-terminal domain-containing protein [Legionella spiritensis]VEG91032.1 type II/III secretion system protein [Legionella spiritensis]